MKTGITEKMSETLAISVSKHYTVQVCAKYKKATCPHMADKRPSKNWKFNNNLELFGGRCFSGLFFCRRISGIPFELVKLSHGACIASWDLFVMDYLSIQSIKVFTFSISSSLKARSISQSLRYEVSIFSVGAKNSAGVISK